MLCHYCSDFIFSEHIPISAQSQKMTNLAQSRRRIAKNALQGSQCWGTRQRQDLSGFADPRLEVLTILAIRPCQTDIILKRIFNIVLFIDTRLSRFQSPVRPQNLWQKRVPADFGMHSR